VAEQSVEDAAGRAGDVEGPTIGVTIRYFAAARAAAGVPEERLFVPTDGPAQGVSNDASPAGQGTSRLQPTVGALLDIAADRHGSTLTTVLARCSFLLDEVAVHGRQTPVHDGQVLDILPPFAGG
jgi:molybdopterin converting factor small subunit